ncbi:protein timeless isoform X2 [Wyeomyia smithii]|uniref:protein timeless isoform X2 n=1 Tax=Wyeomyia smithii TaxID=174621 RepID=UPI002467F29D|nr:protein timeless isoform X2 [Wyeomyia smithii]
MEWLLANPQINSTFGSLGSFVDDIYLVNDDCQATLEEIICKLTVEDNSLRTFRRAIGFGQNVKNDIVPLLIHANDPKIIDTTIRLLVNLTVPVECLLPLDSVSATEIGRHTVFELNKLLITSKEVFVELKTTKAVIDHMKCLLETDGKLSVESCDSINNCLLLLRNILHVPEGGAMCGPVPHPYSSTGHNTSLQNQIIWNLFTQSLDKLLIYFMSCPQRAYWAVTMAQLVALLYKDQHISTLQKLLNIWFESTMSESSEDNESNTSPPKQCSGESSPMLTSDSSDNGSANISTVGKSFEDAKQSTRKEKELPAQTILARAIKSHQKYHSTSKFSEETSDSANNSNDQEGSRPTGTESREVEKYFLCANLSNELHNIQSSLQMHHIPSPAPCVASSKRYASTESTAASKKPSKATAKGRDFADPNTTILVPKIVHQALKNQTKMSLSETSDCGYGTQAEKESISTSSNEDDCPNRKPVHQKPPPNQKQRYNAANKQRHQVSIQEKKELRRKKLVKRSKSNIINMKGLMHHMPTDDDISNLLKEFTVDFLVKGYSYLVQELHVQILSDLQVQIDTSHFFWLVTYFLKFATQLELDMEHINCVLSFDIVSYLTYEGVMLCEQLEQLSREGQADVKPCLRRIHLVVTAIREFLQALDTYKKSTHLTKDDKEKLKTLQLQISRTENLKGLFVLLLRCYNPSLQSRQYLQDLIVTNHFLILLVDGINDVSANKNLLTHIKKFATMEIMHQYGLLLENFSGNGAFVNDCIFTMMHHVGGDLEQIDVLFQPSILKTYSQIWETEYEICDDWSDLIEYVIHKFISTPQPSSVTLTATLPELTSQILAGNRLDSWAQEEKDSLHWYYVQCKQSETMIADILKLFQENGNHQKTRTAIIEQLCDQDSITLNRYDELMKIENPNHEKNLQVSSHPGKKEDEEKWSLTAVNDIQVLRDRLIKENKGKMIVWLQQTLLECCYAKLNLLNPSVGPDSCCVRTIEPIPYLCILKKKSIPIVPWDQEQSSILTYQPFVLLLHKLGFHLPADAKKMFVRIPEFWTTDILYSIALKLGPLDNSMIDFDLSLLGMIDKQQTKEAPRPTMEDLHDNVLETARCAPEVVTCWMDVVRANKTADDKSSRDYQEQQGRTMKMDIETQQESESDNKPSLAVELPPDLPTTVQSSSNDMIIDEHPDEPLLEEHDIVSGCETASVASDLTRMYVSDEEEKHDTSVTSVL